jgi:NAD(P)-dependent dehydrogenase (short-subunit alcohol dehydrogenase family)
VLVNNAGIAGAAPIDQYSPADWEKIVAVNLTGAFNGIQAVVPAMKKAGGGSIVDMSSIQGPDGAARFRRLGRDEVRRARADEGGGRRPREVRHPRQLGASRLHRHADDCARAAGHERRRAGTDGSSGGAHLPPRVRSAGGDRYSPR